jgi:hypothetical protein
MAKKRPAKKRPTKKRPTKGSNAPVKKPAATPAASRQQDDAYSRHRERAAAAQAKKSAAGREIGPIPPMVDPERRERCRLDFRLFCETYFPKAFPLAWSRDHLRVIEAIRAAVLEGALLALAMPRGSGKTTLCERGVIWAVLYGHHPYAMLIAADDKKARKALSKIKTELQANPLLIADFPAVCRPIQKLERIANRCNGQTCEGVPTCIEWTKDTIVLPTIAGSVASGAVIGVGGITSAVRGAHHVLPDGRIIRPRLILLDDPQTRRSAKSAALKPAEDDRAQIIAADVLGMAAPGEVVSALLACTVIYPGDTADRLLNPELHPDWRGERCALLYRFPDNMELWGEYRDLRADLLRQKAPPAEIAQQLAEFYNEHQADLEKGAEVAWPERKGKREVSALQHAMNLFFADERAFWSEYQNAPNGAEVEQESEFLSVEQIAAKVHGLARGVVPLACTHVTAFVDVQEKLLYWLVAAWADDFSGAVLDYGTFPDQKTRHFSLRQARSTLAHKFPGAGPEARLLAGLNALVGELCTRPWRREDGAELKIERLLVDAGDQTDQVYQFCRETRFSQVMPSHGKAPGAKKTQFSEHKRQRGEKLGNHWRIPNVAGKRACRHVLMDVNYWKSFVQRRLVVPHGDRGSLVLYQGTPTHHRLLAEHLTAETCTVVSTEERTIEEWDLPSHRPDNHWLDCLVGAAVGADMLGCTLTGDGSMGAKRGAKIRLSDLQKRRGESPPAPAAAAAVPAEPEPTTADVPPGPAATGAKKKVRLSDLRRQREAG